PQIAIGLKDSRSLPPLHALLELQDDPLDQGPEQKNGQDLGNLQQDIPRHHAKPSPAAGQRTCELGDIEAEMLHRWCVGPRIRTPPAICQSHEGVISPEGGYKANSIACRSSIPYERLNICQ